MPCWVTSWAFNQRASRSCAAEHFSERIAALRVPRKRPPFGRLSFRRWALLAIIRCVPRLAQKQATLCRRNFGRRRFGIHQIVDPPIWTADNHPLNLTREGRRDFEPVRSRPAKHDRRFICCDHVCASGWPSVLVPQNFLRSKPPPPIVQRFAPRLLEQDFLHLDRHALKSSKAGRFPGLTSSVREARTKLGLAIFSRSPTTHRPPAKFISQGPPSRFFFGPFPSPGTQAQAGQGI